MDAGKVYGWVDFADSDWATETGVSGPLVRTASACTVSSSLQIPSPLGPSPHIGSKVLLPARSDPLQSPHTIVWRPPGKMLSSPVLALMRTLEGEDGRTKYSSKRSKGLVPSPPEARNNDAWQQSSDGEGDHFDPHCSQASCSTTVDADLGCEEGILAAEQGPALHALELPASQAPYPSYLVDDPEDTEDMLRHLREMEAELAPTFGYMDGHSAVHQPLLFVDGNIRSIVVAWLVELSVEPGLHQETVFLAISLLDRFLGLTKGVPRTVLQLVSVACVLIACKHEEETHPSVERLTELAGFAFEEEELLHMERTVLNSLGFRINAPTAYTFWSIFRMSHAAADETSSLALYLTELAQLDYGCLRYPPSKLAAAAMLVAHAHVGDRHRLSALSATSGYSLAVLQECAATLLSLHARATAALDSGSPFAPVKDKYTSEMYFFASRVAPLARLPADFQTTAGPPAQPVAQQA